MEEQATTHQPEWVFESDADKLLGIETRVYDNGHTVKRCILTNGHIAIVRELLGEDMIEADKLAGSQQELSLPAIMAKATKLGNKPLLLEDLKLLKAKDYNKIKVMAAALNF